MRTYRIETERLVIRCYQPEHDAPLLTEAVQISLPELLPWMPWARFEPQSLEQRTKRLATFREDFISGKDFSFGIFNKEETMLLGSTGLHTRIGEHAREIGYWTRSDFSRQGIMTETVSALCNVAFRSEDMHWVEIRCDSRNVLSKKIPARLHFTLTDITDGKDVNDLPRKTEIWSLSKEAFEKGDLPKMKLKAFDHSGKEILL